MALKLPTYSELIKRSAQSMNSAVDGLDAFKSRSVAKVLCKIMAAFNVSLYQYLNQISKNLFVNSCDYETLLKKAAEQGVYPTQASFATGKVIFSATAGTFIPANTILKNKSGIKYQTVDDVTVNSTEQIILSIIAKTRGKTSNMDANTDISFETPIVGIDTNGKVDENGIIGGADAETKTDFRRRFEDYLKDPPGCGDPAYYEYWAKTQPGVTRAWCIRQYKGPSTVGLMFMMDKNYDDGIPQSGDIDKLQEYLQNIAPAGTTVYVFVPDALKINFVISDLSPNNPSIKQSIQMALHDFILESYKPNDVIFISQLDNIISEVEGEVSHTLLKPDLNINIGKYEIPILGSINYVNGGSDE